MTNKPNLAVMKWTRQNFKISKPKKKDFSNMIKSAGAELLSVVHKGSPADILGIKPGWILMFINGKKYNDEIKIKRKYLGKVMGKHEFTFFDPAEKRVYSVKSKFWPFGMVLTQPAQKISEALNGSGDNFNWSDVHGLWKLGLNDQMAELYPVLEELCASLDRQPKPGSFPPENVEFGENVYADALAATTFAALSAGQNDRANFLLQQTKKSLKETQSVSGFTVAMHYHSTSILAESAGNMALAEDAIHSAFERNKTIPVVNERLEKLTGQPQKNHQPNYVGTKLELDYVLRNTDPVGEIPSTGQPVAFKDAITGLRKGQLLLVFIMGSYRSNSYYIDDLIAAAPIFKRFPGIVKHIHVVVESDYTLHPEDRQTFEKMVTTNGLKLTILFDQEQTVTSQIDTSGYPSRLFFNDQGIVLCDKPLWDESGIWEAFRLA